MLVILKESVANLGKTGDIVKVSAGYARNFLLPQGKVLVANEKNVKELDHHKKILEKKRLAEKADAELLVTKLEAVSVNISRKAGENDKLFGSVTASDIADELSKNEFKVDKKDIKLSEPLRTLGVHPVEIKLLSDVTATVKVWVVKEEN
ncbi:MAG: 50S ribosomal protein L9 [Bdellovibrionaceae bacterium]|nr:50S ribosomal protein L9 [Pseudobdellovibrionaceae bacterium]|tara:strand:+ start:1918 stop:2367 length:450 start_codon:yes stop_codon:yes gene_type:complete